MNQTISGGVVLLFFWGYLHFDFVVTGSTGNVKTHSKLTSVITVKLAKVKHSIVARLQHQEGRLDE